MRAFRVTLEIRVQKHVTIAAADVQAAAKAALRFQGSAARVLDVALDIAPGPTSGLGILRYIMAAPFLPLAGQGATLKDWVKATHAAPTDAEFAAHNRQLAMAGLRVFGYDRDILIVGSPGSIPTLGDILDGSPFANEEILTALARIPGSRKAVRHFLGINSRTVSLPWKEIAEVLA